MITTSTTKEGAAYRTTVREMPDEERPRKRVERNGAATLQRAEPLVIVLRGGSTRVNVIELAAQLLRQYSGVGGLPALDFAELYAEHGMGPAKTTQVKAAPEIGRRLSLLTSEARPQIKSPGDAAQLVMFCAIGLVANLRVAAIAPPTRAATWRHVGGPRRDHAAATGTGEWPQPCAHSHALTLHTG